MTSYLIAMLKALEQIVPPGDGCHHAICYCQYGSAESGWADKLCVCVRVNGTTLNVFLDDADFNKLPGALAADIAVALS